MNLRLNDRIKKILKIFVICLLTFVFLFGIGEVIRRYTDPRWVLSMALKYRPYAFARHIFEPHEQDARNRNHSEYSYHINRHGFRGDDFSIEKPEGQVRILMYGSSHLFDSRSEPPSWPERIEEILHEKGYAQVEVINAGIPGHTSPESVTRLFSRGHFLDPDYVFLVNGWSDLKFFNTSEPFPLYSIKPYHPSEAPKRVYRNSVDRFLGEHSVLYTHLRSRFYSHLEDLETAKSKEETALETLDERAIEQYRLTVELFVKLSEMIDATPVLVTQARLVSDSNTKKEIEEITRASNLTHETLLRGYRIIDETLRRSARENENTLLWDLSPRITGQSKYFQDHVHVNNLGSKKLAQLTAEFMEGHLIRPAEE